MLALQPLYSLLDQIDRVRTALGTSRRVYLGKLLQRQEYFAAAKVAYQLAINSGRDSVVSVKSGQASSR